MAINRNRNRLFTSKQINGAFDDARVRIVECGRQGLHGPRPSFYVLVLEQARRRAESDERDVLSTWELPGTFDTREAADAAAVAVLGVAGAFAFWVK